MARVGFEPKPCWSRARRFNHSTTLPTKINRERSIEQETYDKQSLRCRFRNRLKHSQRASLSVRHSSSLPPLSWRLGCQVSASLSPEVQFESRDCSICKARWNCYTKQLVSEQIQLGELCFIRKGQFRKNYRAQLCFSCVLSSLQNNVSTSYGFLSVFAVSSRSTLSELVVLA